MSQIGFRYNTYIKGLTEDWQVEVANIFRFLDEQCEGALPRDVALKGFDLIGIKGEEYIHTSKKSITIQQFIEAVGNDKRKNFENNERRWKYIFSLIAGSSDNTTITTEKLRDFFTFFGHTPDLKYCEDFIDEFDRNHLTKTEICLEDWIMFCRVHRLPF